MDNFRVATGSGINWCWYLIYSFVGDRVKIHYHGRLHNSDHCHLQAKLDKLSTSGFVINETPDRKTETVSLGDKEYMVENPAYVFSYEGLKQFAESL